ncbi:MAG TPA: serine/threonine-protein kinase [Streptosporangiaceae bacterium]|nr:serine/threonine-protein kinase [Streptosporangiaceae bacterium]
MGGYRLAARLGSGGMGVVYLGVTGDGRLVAVKVLRPELADDPECRARFDREAAVLARVRGAHILRVIEAGTDSGAYFLVTEYAAGPSLARYIGSAGPLGAEMLHGLAVGLAEALTVIHGAGVVHRDLKPANVILAADGPKVIDFGIAQVPDSVSLTRAGTTIGSAGFMAPEQIEGHAGQAADVFAWAVTVAYAASGQPPFGTGSTDAIIYRIRNREPSLAAVPKSLRPVVKAALAVEPRRRPTADEILGQLTDSPGVPGHGALAATEPIRARSPAGTEAESALLEPAAPGTRRPGARKRPASLRATLAVPVLVVTVVVALALALVLLAGPGLETARIAGDQRASAPRPAPPATAFGTYPGQRNRGVLQTISRIVASGNTIVTTGAQVSDGTVRQQFFASADGGATWRLASVHGPGGGLAPAGHAATRVAGGPAGWLATGPQAIWTSRDGLSWTLAATHGVTPQRPGDQVYVLTATADGFLAAGQTPAPGGGTQAVIWTSPNGLTWHRMTAAHAGLDAEGQDVTSVSYAAWVGDATVIAGNLSTGGWGTWLSTDGGTTWTPVAVPVGHGADGAISGLGSDSSGLIAVRPGAAGDAIAYFSPNGQTWQYAGTIGTEGGFRPAVVKGSGYGFVVTGTNAAGDDLAYTSTGDGSAWRPTRPLGTEASYASGLAATVGSDEEVIAAGSTAATKTGQQAVVLRASTSGTVRPVALDAIPGAVVPEVAVNALAYAGGQEIAVGSADGYPAIWRKTAAGSWTLASTLPLVSDISGQSALTSVTHGAAGWLAVGTPGPVAYTSANGATWQPASSIAGDLHGVVGVAAAAGPQGYVIVGKLIAAGGACVADVWWSAGLVTWTRAHDVTDASGSSQVLAVAAGPHGFISAGSHDGQPAVWTTADGSSWTTIVLPLAAGSSGVLQQIAIDGHRVVALGTRTAAGTTTPLAEVSADGGRTWRQVPLSGPGADVAVTALTADSGGFAAAVQAGAPGQQQVTIWTSADGASWRQADLGGLSGSGSHQLAALAPTGSTVTGIGVTASAQSQQPFIVTAPIGR